MDVLLGDKPALTPPQNFYQRLLAHDPEEAAEQAESFMKDRPLEAYYDEVALEGLELAQSDLSRGALDGAQVLEIRESVEALVDDLSDHEDAVEAAEPVSDAVVQLTDPRLQPTSNSSLLPTVWNSENAVLCVGGRSALDDAACLLLEQLLQRRGLVVKVASFDTLSVAGISRLDLNGVKVICLSYLDTSSLAHLRFAVRRLRRRLPDAKVVIGCWGQDPAAAAEMAKSAKADFSATSLHQAIEKCTREPTSDLAADTIPKVA